jgi:hypothetical protein
MENEINLGKSSRRLRRQFHPNLSNTEVYKRTIHAEEKSYWDEESKTVKTIWVDKYTGKPVNVEPRRMFRTDEKI